MCQLVKLSTVLFDEHVDAEGRSELLKNYLNFHRINSNEHLKRQQSHSPQKSRRDTVDLMNLISELSMALVDVHHCVCSESYEQSNSTKVLTSADDALDGNKRVS